MKLFQENLFICDIHDPYKKIDILDFIKINHFSSIKNFQRMKIMRLYLKVLYLIQNKYI